MKFLSFDLELNQASTGAKIIEIGACIGDTETREVLATYTCLVNPNETMEQRIIELTGITQQDVDGGISIVEAYVGMEKLGRAHGCLRMPLVWGGGDGSDLRSELPADVKWGFGHRELDAKAVYQAYQVAVDGSVHAGLSKAMKKLGLNFQGTPHRAKDDAVNTFLIFCELLARFKSEQSSLCFLDN